MKPRAGQRLRIIISLPAVDVLSFALNPENTPSWLDFVESETASEWPPRIGTVYTSRARSGSVTCYELTELTPGAFTLSTDSGYHVRYAVTRLSSNSSELEYQEWSDSGYLEHPFTSAELESFRQAAETQAA